MKFTKSKSNPVLLGAVRILLGAVFIFSGFVKGVDPWGTAIKLDEYFAAFGLEWLSGARYVLSIALSSAEMLLGFMLLFDIRLKFTSGAVLVFMGAFTVLTLIVAITNPISDCGCFGEVIKLSNRATFGKNVILLASAVWVFIGARRREARKCGASLDFIMVLLLASIAIFIGSYSITHLPLIDFLPYKTGVNIQRSMSALNGGERGEYRTTLIYRNIATGETREFEVEDTTWHNSAVWEFVDTRSIEVKKGHAPVITGFAVFNESSDITSDLLSNFAEVFIITIDDLRTVTPEDMAEIEKVKQFAARENGRILVVTTSPAASVDMGIPVYNMDATTLKMLIRAHKGVVVLDRGTIIAKWNIADIPDLNATTHGSVKDYIITKKRTNSVRESIAFFCGAIAVLLVFYRSRCGKFS